MTVSAIRPLLKHIVQELMASSDVDCTPVKEMKETIVNDLQHGTSMVAFQSLLTSAQFWIQGSECSTFEMKRRLLLG